MTMPTQTDVYCLKHRGVPYYVGVTNNLNARHRQHCERKKATTPAEARNQEILASGLEPEIELLETFDTALQALIHEIYWIIHFGKQGYEILNREHVGYVYEQARKLMGDARLHGKMKNSRPKTPLKAASKAKGRSKGKKRPQSSPSNLSLPNQGKPWDDKADEALLDMAADKISVSAMAQALGRSETAITMRLEKLQG